MPYATTVKIPANLLRVGDTVVKDDGRNIVVTGVEVKTKWVYVTHNPSTGPVMERVVTSSYVTVTQEKMTLAEIASDNLDRIVRRIRSAIENAPGRVDDARSALIEAMAMYDPVGHYDAYELFITAQVEKTLWTRVYMISKNLEIDLLAAAMKVANEVVTDLLDTRFNNTSTSVMSNASWDVEMATRAAWARRIRTMVDYGG